MNRYPGRRRLLLSVAAVSLLLAACGGGNTNTTSATSDNAKMAITQSQTTNNVDPQTTDNTQHDRLQVWFEAYLVKYPQLAAGTQKLGKATEVSPDLATAWQVSASGIEFTLRSGAKSEFGNTLTADDVKWSLDRSLALSPGQVANLSSQGYDVKNLVTIVSPGKVKMTATAAGLTPNAIGYFAQLVPSAILDSTEAKKHVTTDDPWAKLWLKDHSASFGPFKVSELQANQQVTLVRNPNYWGTKPGFSQVTVVAQSNPTTAVQQLRSGQIQVATELPYGEAQTLNGQKGVKLVTAPSLNVDLLVLNKHYKPFTDENVRKAISLALDRGALVKGPYGNFAHPAVSPVSSAQSGLQTFPALAFDLTRAKEAMAASAYPKGFDVVLAGSPASSGSVDLSSLFTFLKAQLAPLGINVTPTLVASGPDYTAGLRADKYQAMAPVSDQPALPDAATSMTFFFTTKGVATGLFGHESDSDFDALVNKTNSTPAGAEHDANLNKMVQYFLDHMIDVPMVETQFVYGMSDKVCGFTPSPRQNIFPATLKPC